MKIQIFLITLILLSRSCKADPSDSRVCTEYTMTTINTATGTTSTSVCTKVSSGEMRAQVSVEDTECFSGDTIVYEVFGSSADPIKMNDLNIGDVILDGEKNPTKVIGFLHKERIIFPHKVGMIRFLDSDGKEIMTVSEKHLLFDSKDRSKFANEFRQGDTFYPKIKIGEIQHITIIPAQDEGYEIYAPLTESGTMLLGKSKVKVSCYSEVRNHAFAHVYVQLKHKFSPYLGNVSGFDSFLLSYLR